MKWIFLLIASFAFSMSLLTAHVFAADSQEPVASESLVTCTPEIAMTDTIGPGSLSLLERAFDRAKRDSCSSILITINTPGGSLQTTRMIVEKILNSPVPILCLVSPSGGHAGSAGAIILQACHVNGAMTATNIGAATPISGTGEAIPDDLRKKLINDTRSWVEGITEHRGRSKSFGADIITEAKSVSADEAKKIGAIDFVATKKSDFLEFSKGREVKLTEQKTTEVKVGELQYIEPSLRDLFLTLFGDPQLAYLLLMGSLALLYFEITHPGTMVAGVVGAVALVVALIALHKLQVEWGGLMLLLLGLALLIAEAFLPSFGILGVGGIAAFVMGSLFLFDPEKTGGYQLPLVLILATAGTIGAIMLTLGFLAFRTFGLKPKWGGDEMAGQKAVVVDLEEDPREGRVEVMGEIWRFKCSTPVTKGQVVLVEKLKGLTLLVKEF